ncbi:MAG TPA: glycosyltransferase [Tepidisphaeraceae bacterium]
MSDPIFSVVIPCYNSAEYLRDCVLSVWAQKANTEIIIVDDGSTDDTHQRAKAIMAEHLRQVVLITQGNQGAAAARNAGLRIARGKFIAFLDADDRYAPGFFEAAFRRFESDPALAAIFCEIEFVNAHRPIEPWQKKAMEDVAPGTLIVRTEIARQLGGFPTDKAFRGKAAGEDCVFRMQVLAAGKMVKLQAPMLKYTVRPGSHFDYFLDRAIFKDGKIDVQYHSQEELDGTYDKAALDYAQEIHRRKVRRIEEQMHHAFPAAVTLIQNFPDLEKIPGFLHPLEGFALNWFARHWPGTGCVVEIGSFKGKSASYLARGMKAGAGGRLHAIDHFHGSPEHQPAGTHPDKDIASSGSTLEAFKQNIAAAGVSDMVDIHSGASVEIGANWREPIRLLFIDGDHSYEASSQDFLLWSPRVQTHGLVILHDIGTYEGVTNLYNQVVRDTQHWRHIVRIQSLAVLERLA